MAAPLLLLAAAVGLACGDDVGAWPGQQAALRGRRTASAAEGASAGAGAVIYVGSGACDGDDRCPEVQDATAKQKILQGFSLDSDGKLVQRPDLATAVDSLPVWLATNAASSGNDSACVFVTRVMSNAVLALPVGAGDRLELPGDIVPSAGCTPVDIAVSSDGRQLLVTNYNGDSETEGCATVASYLVEDGCALKLAGSAEHHGSSKNPWRQTAAHLHSALIYGDGLAFVCDLGMDVIFTYQLLPDGQLREAFRMHVEAGLGPRHMVRHPSEPFLYVICEMGQVVLVYSVGPQGELALLQSASLLADGASGEGSKAAELAISPAGNALFASNRGVQNTVTVFAVAAEGGRLAWKQQVDTVRFPRGMTLAQQGTSLLVAGQTNSELAVYPVSSDGTLGKGSLVTEGVPPNPVAFVVLPASP